MNTNGGKKPGSAVARIGLIVFGFGALLVLMTIGRTESQVVYTGGRFDTVEHWVGPAPLTIAIAVIGAGIAAFGYYKRRTA
jgi:hypothetical protein